MWAWKFNNSNQLFAESTAITVQYVDKKFIFSNWQLTTLHMTFLSFMKMEIDFKFVTFIQWVLKAYFLVLSQEGLKYFLF